MLCRQPGPGQHHSKHILAKNRVGTIALQLDTQSCTRAAPGSAGRRWQSALQAAWLAVTPRCTALQACLSMPQPGSAQAGLPIFTANKPNHRITFKLSCSKQRPEPVTPG